MTDSAIDPVTCFAATYVQARDRFLEATAARGATIERHMLISARGAEGEVLSMDTALLGERQAPGLLVLTSGTHGVEGFCGSGCQIALLRDDAFAEAVSAAGVAVLFVHAVNPYGFSYLRRVNEDNADVNRNFHDFRLAPPVNAGYAALHAALLPKDWPPAPENSAAIAAFIARGDAKAFQAAVSGGQYAFPDGLFYGGSAPAWSNRTIRAMLRQHAAMRTRMGWIDFHTGLGPPGHGERIYAGRDNPEDLARARRWWGPEVTSFHEGSSTSAMLTGVMYLAAYEECPGVEYTGIALEYGTVPLEEAFEALRADHWLHTHREASADLHRSIKHRIRDAFFIDTAEWKRTVVAQARDAAFAAVEHLRPRTSGHGG